MNRLRVCSPNLSQHSKHASRAHRTRAPQSAAQSSHHSLSAITRHRHAERRLVALAPMRPFWGIRDVIADKISRFSKALETSQFTRARNLCPPPTKILILPGPTCSEEPPPPASDRCSPTRRAADEQGGGGAELFGAKTTRSRLVELSAEILSGSPPSPSDGWRHGRARACAHQGRRAE